MTWGELLAEKRAALLPLDLVAWLLTDEARVIPYNPWLKALTHARADLQREALAAEWRYVCANKWRCEVCGVEFDGVASMIVDTCKCGPGGTPDNRQPVRTE